MGMLDNVTTTISDAGIRLILAGPEGIGKTTFACSSPNPLLVPLEQGYGGMTVAKVPMLESYEQIMQLLTEITAQAQQGKFPYKTIIFDSLTALERLIHQSILEGDPSYTKGNKKALTMTSAMGGFGKAYQYANELFTNFLKSCDQLAIYGKINIVLTCHVFAATLIDPTSGEYSSWDLQIHSPKNQKEYGKRELSTQWCDILAFVYEPVYITEAGSISRGVSQNKGRMMGVCRTPNYVAKNRYNIVGELSIPKEDGWNVLARAVHENSGVDCYKR